MIRAKFEQDMTHEEAEYSIPTVVDEQMVADGSGGSTIGNVADSAGIGTEFFTNVN